jgi:hypothetical protein
MIEEITLPLDAVLFCEPAFHVGDGTLHGCLACERKKAMQMVWHDKEQTALELPLLFAMLERFHDTLPYIGFRQLVLSAWFGADGDEIDFVFWIRHDGWWYIVWEAFAADVHGMG